MNNFNHMSGTSVDIDGIEIYYEITGNENAPVLLLLHGGFGNIEDFNVILPDLNKQFKIIGVDSRGHGKSTLSPEPLTYERLQKDVEMILSHLGINKLSIMGFSDGGIVAYRLATMTSLNIEKLMTIGADWHFKNTDRLKGIFSKITGESWRKKFPSTYDSYQQLNPKPDFDFFTQSIVKMWLDATPSGYPNETVKNISCPLLIVRGDEDHLFSRYAAVELSEHIKHAHLLNIPFAGHVAFEDQKEIFMLSLNQFLKQ